MTTASTPRPTSRLVLTVALVAGLVSGIFDVALAILKRTPSFENPMLVFPAVFATALATALACALLWWICARPCAARLRLRADPLLHGLAVGITVWLICIRIADLPIAAPSIAQLFAFLLFAAVALVTGIGAYFAAVAIVDQPHRTRRAAAALLALPALLFAMLVFLWAQLYWIESARSSAGIEASLAMLLVAAGVFWFGPGRTDVARARALSMLVAAATLAIPAALGIYAWVFERLGSDERSDHPVQHIILISSDTLRADMLGTYGAAGDPTPAIDGLARDGSVFENVISVAPWTLPSLSTMISGVPPAVHLVTQEDDRLPGSITTLAERFAAAGYHTAAIVDNAYLRPKANLNQGFQDYIFYDVPDYGHSIGAAILQPLLPQLYRPERPVTIREHTERVSRWLTQNARRDFFLWVHFFDPHTPYEPAPEDVIGDPPAGMGYSFTQPPQVMSGMIARSDAQKNWIRKLYEGEVRGVDAGMASVLERLRELGVYDEAVIAFTSDHGEEFWEHGGQGHGHTLYNELLHVPLILKLPRRGAGERITTPVSSARLAMSLLDAADVAYDDAELAGPSLLGLIREDLPQGVQTQPIVSSSSIIVDDQQAVTFESHKYIRSLVNTREELYDLARDPGEHQSQVSRLPAVVESARALLDDHARAAQIVRERSGVGEGESAPVDAATLKRLKGLGYIN